MRSDSAWLAGFRLDIDFGYLAASQSAPRNYNPRLVLNQDGSTVGHVLVEELRRCRDFTFSVAFISPSAIAQLKQHLVDFDGAGRIVTADFLGFNRPEAFAELLALKEHAGIDVRRHTAAGFHPKGYIFEHEHSLTAMIGSANLTSAALSQNHEWNLKVSAAAGSDLADQLSDLVAEQVRHSVPLTEEWIDEYAATFVAPAPRAPTAPSHKSGEEPSFQPNAMQQDALLALDLVRANGAKRAIVISATGTGKTILSALDVRSVNPDRFLFVVHREQILDRTIQEYRRVLGGSANEYGKLTGSLKQDHRRYVFATIQTLAQPEILTGLPANAFDYILIDEAHRAGAATYQRIIKHFDPAFLLGMTATPERTDGFDVFELFEYNVPYEIRLKHALEEGMLSPFHYYGVADVTYADGSSTTDETELRLLISPERVGHLLKALDLYAQAGVEPRGLIFCSRKEEAHALANALNESTLRGRQLRTVALTGDDPIAVREKRVAELESGGLDYILSVDVFNEGVDIPTVNQVVMLRQTQSAIVFVQQLGRGLRLSDGKDYLVVIDFIGNYATNFLIPIALFGDQSLNKESLREKLNETIEGGTLPGLSSVSFDEIARERVLASIASNALDSMANLKTALVAMQHRVGRIPTLWDFHRFESVDPMLLATKKEHFLALTHSLLRAEHRLSESESKWLQLISHEVLPAKRLHETVLLRALIERGRLTTDEIATVFTNEGIASDEVSIRAAIDSLALRGYSQGDERRYKAGVASESAGSIELQADVVEALNSNPAFTAAVDDVLTTAAALITARYEIDVPFSAGMQYSRRDAARIVGWPRSTSSTIYGYKTDAALGVATIFVTLHKNEDVAASTAYEDALLDLSSMRWFSKSNRTMMSPDVAPIVQGAVDLHVFVKKDDAEGSDHYYLGCASAHDPIETTMPDSDGEQLRVVRMTLHFEKPVRQGLFDYFGSTAE